MNPHAFYLAAAYGAFALAVVVELALLARRRQRARQAIDDDEAMR